MEAIKKESKEAYEWLCAEEEEPWAKYKFQADTKCPDNTTNFAESFNGKIEKFRYKPVWTLLEAIRKKFMSTIVRKFEIANGWSGKLCPRPVTDPIFWEDSDCPRLGPPEIEVKRGRPPSERRRDGTEKRKSFSRSSTLRCSVCKQYGHNSRSHMEGGKLSIWRGKDKPSYKSKTGSTRKVGRPPKHSSQPSNDITSQPSTSQSKKGKKRKASICGTSVVKKARKGKASL
ncbi:hypothetical protein Cgig2_014557 [Carnegiea gigantea]|uniref:Uncharacterized protein n=1 Tax=Carnegiea gigantea TaxID=171969 RepID=A0A9Q1L002_9CARY|nr:hypothetical protein Cgig2_014557 [Carnegiea gigantea]